MTPAEVQKAEPEYFHQLINIEDFAAFLDDARGLAKYYFAIGGENEESFPAGHNFKRIPKYTEVEFDRRMRKYTTSM